MHQTPSPRSLLFSRSLSHPARPPNAAGKGREEEGSGAARTPSPPPPSPSAGRSPSPAPRRRGMPSAAGTHGGRSVCACTCVHTRVPRGGRVGGVACAPPVSKAAPPERYRRNGRLFPSGARPPSHPEPGKGGEHTGKEKPLRPPSLPPPPPAMQVGAAAPHSACAPHPSAPSSSSGSPRRRHSPRCGQPPPAGGVGKGVGWWRLRRRERRSSGVVPSAPATEAAPLLGGSARAAASLAACLPPSVPPCPPRPLQAAPPPSRRAAPWDAPLPSPSLPALTWLRGMERRGGVRLPPLKPGVVEGGREGRKGGAAPPRPRRRGCGPQVAPAPLVAGWNPVSGGRGHGGGARPGPSPASGGSSRLPCPGLARLLRGRLAREKGRFDLSSSLRFSEAALEPRVLGVSAAGLPGSSGKPAPWPFLGHLWPCFASRVAPVGTILLLFQDWGVLFQGNTGVFTCV